MMTHTPPIPPGNQSPFPIEEPPHPPAPPAPPEADAEADDGHADEHGVHPGLIAAAVGALGAVALGVTALLRLRRDGDKPAPKRRAARKRKSTAGK